MRPFEIIATISPEVATAESLRAFIERGVTILRINGAHTSAEAARTLIDSVHESVGQDVDILLDFPGNKIRTKNLAKPRVVTADQPFTMCADEFNYPGFLSHLRPGNVLLANDSKLRFVVESCDAETAQFIADFDGVLEPNKGIHVVGFHPPLPFLLERDHELIQVAKDWGVDFLGLSFVRKAEDVAQVLELLDESPIDIICKIETREACERIDDILPLTSRILIDRGDLSSEIGMYNVPAMEDAITRRGKAIWCKGLRSDPDAVQHGAASDASDGRGSGVAPGGTVRGWDSAI